MKAYLNDSGCSGLPGSAWGTVLPEERACDQSQAPTLPTCSSHFGLSEMPQLPWPPRTLKHRRWPASNSYPLLKGNMDAMALD